MARISHNVQATRKAAHNAVVLLGKKERGLEASNDSVLNSDQCKPFQMLRAACGRLLCAVPTAPPNYRSDSSTETPSVLSSQ
jgi:hypothetical protein